MDEKLIIKGKFKLAKLAAWMTLGLAIVFIIISNLMQIIMYGELEYGFIEALAFYDVSTGLFAYLGIISFLFAGVMFFTPSCELIVTNKRIYGKTCFGHKVELPLDKISLIVTCFPFGIIVGTSAGVGRFLGLSNRKEVFEAISAQLIARQDNLA